MSRQLLIFYSIFLIGTGLQMPAQTPVLSYGTGSWEADTLGNHRVVVRVTDQAPAVKVRIPWRRRDWVPEKKEVLVVSAATDERVNNVIRLQINREEGQFLFEPIDGPGDYYFYYLPNRRSGSRNYPTVTYLEPVDRSDANWRKENPVKRTYPEARAVLAQAINPLNSFYPMEVIATEKEVRQLLDAAPGNYYLFPELRDYPVRMFDAIPYRWVERGWQYVLQDTVQQKEYYAFQIAVHPVHKDIHDLNVAFSDLKTSDGKRIPAAAMTCFHKTGNNWDQSPMEKSVPVPKGRVQPLWCGIDVAADQPPGLYSGTVTIHPDGMEPSSVPIELTIIKGVLEDRGDSEPWKHSRLRWLNSDIAVDYGIIPPYTPIHQQGNSLHILGREIVLGPGGFPQQIISYFAPEMTRLAHTGVNMLTDPMRFEIGQMTDDGVRTPTAGFEGIRFSQQGDGLVTWTSGFSYNCPSGEKTATVSFDVEGHLEFDGYLSYQVTCHTDHPVDLDEILFRIPLNSDIVRYSLGLGRKGGAAPEQFRYNWDPYYNIDGTWLGTVNAGLQATFSAENYERPLNTNFYQQKPLNMPPSWYNQGKGGISLDRQSDQYQLVAYTGSRMLEPGEDLYFNIKLLITPFRTLDTEKQWHDRYYHSFKPLDTIAAVGANTINVHHATDINPYINYPFMTPDIMKAYVDAAHEQDIKVKIYYTVRELTNICPEIWALKSLGDEILSYGSGGGFSWLQEHLDGNYIAAWFVPDWKDAAVINSGVSRWHNYYLEGLNWLVGNVGIDGLYIDDVAFDRSVMQRVRKVLERGNPAPRIDLHSANQFNPRDGFVNSAHLYMEHFPYIDRLWFGEYFDYDAGPDYWMTEVSGIPFGLMGEMLQDGGNRWRGMLYGMTSRAPWSGDPTPLWKLWDEFGMAGSEMIGYWVEDNPVKTSRPDILATIYRKPESCLIALASWASGPARVELDIDWDRIGMDPAKVSFYLPPVKDLQEEQYLLPGKSFQVPEGKGFLILIREDK